MTKIKRFIQLVIWWLGITMCVECLDIFRWRRTLNHNEFGSAMCTSCYASAVADEHPWEFWEYEGDDFWEEDDEFWEDEYYLTTNL